MEIFPTKNISVKEYLVLDDAAKEKWEYAHGEMVVKSGETEAHNSIVANLLRETGCYLKGKGCTIYPSAFRITLSTATSYFYPDAIVVQGKCQLEPDIFDTLLNPLILFEVMSENTVNIDRGYKFFHYKQIPSLQEYILINSREYAVEVIRRQPDNAWKFEKYFSQHNALTLRSINLTISFDDLYYKVSLPQ